MQLAETALIAGAFALVVALLPLMNRMAFGLGWTDSPANHKTHVGIIPLSGGLTIFLAVSLTLLLTGTGWPAAASGLVGGLAIMLFIGLWDDCFPLRARYRLIAQAAASIVIIASGRTVLYSMGQTFGPVEIGLWYFAFPITVVALTGLVNAFNMSDGLDGLCGGYVLIALASLLGSAALMESRDPLNAAFTQIAPIVLPFAGAIVAFLLFNMRHPWREKASVFLGDAGSMALGFLVGWLTLRLAGLYGPHSLPPVVAVYIVALPLADMFSCMIRRVMDGATPMSADKKHLHHLLLNKGFSVRKTVAFLHAVSAALAATGIWGWIAGVPEYLMFWSLILMFTVFATYTLRYWRAVGSFRVAH